MKKLFVILMMVIVLTGCDKDTDDPVCTEEQSLVDGVCVDNNVLKVPDFISDVVVPQDIRAFILSKDNPIVAYYNVGLAIVIADSYIYKVETGKEVVEFYSTNLESCGILPGYGLNYVSVYNNYDSLNDTFIYDCGSLYELDFNTLTEERITDLYGMEYVFDGGSVNLNGEPAIYFEDGTIQEFKYYHVATYRVSNEDIDYIIYKNITGAKCDVQVFKNGDLVSSNEYDSFCGDVIYNIFEDVVFLECLDNVCDLKSINYDGEFKSLVLSNVSSEDQVSINKRHILVEDDSGVKRVYDLNLEEVDLSGTSLEPDEIVNFNDDYVFGFNTLSQLIQVDRVTKDVIQTFVNECTHFGTDIYFFSHGFRIMNICNGLSYGQDVYNLENELVMEDLDTFGVFYEDEGYYYDYAEDFLKDVYIIDYDTFSMTLFLEDIIFSMKPFYPTGVRLYEIAVNEEDRMTVVQRDFMIYDLNGNYVDTYHLITEKGYPVFINDADEMIFGTSPFTEMMYVDIYN